MSHLFKFIARHYLCIFVILIFMALTFLAQRQFYRVDHYKQLQQLSALEQGSDHLDQQYQKTYDENSHLNLNLSQTKIITEEQQYELNLQQATLQKLEEQISIQQAHITTIEKELLFYQTINQGDRPKELQIRELRLLQDPHNSGIVHYWLVITQGKKINQAIEADIEMRLITPQGEYFESTELAKHKLNLRHVQLIKGQIVLSDGETPDSISITIKQQKKELLSQSFNWQLSPALE